MAKTVVIAPRVAEKILRPGDTLPTGSYIKGWKLDPGQYGKDAFCLHFDPEGGD
jgi:hypothetical protein